MDLSNVRRFEKADELPVLSANSAGAAPPLTIFLPALDQLVALAADMLGVSMGFVSFPVQGRQFIRAQYGIAGPLRPADTFMPPAMLASPDVTILGDTLAGDGAATVPATTLLGARFALAIPLGESSRPAGGMLCLFDTAPRDDRIDPRTLGQLRALAAIAGTQRGRPDPRVDTLALRAAAYAALYDGAVRWSADREGRMLDVSSGWTRLTGTPMARALGHGWLHYVHPDDHAAVLALARSAQPVGNIRVRLRAADRSWRWTETRRLSSHDPTSGAVWFGVSEDVHDRVVAEEALRESEAHHRNSVELSPQIPWTAYPDGSIDEVGPLWQQVTGITAEEARGEGWIKALHADDVPATVEIWHSAISRREPVDVEYRVCTGEGGYRWMRARAAPRLDENGAIVRWYGTLEDVHDRRLAQLALADSEERFRLAVQAARLGIWDYDATTRESRWSAELIEMLGLPAGTEPGMAAALGVIHPDDRRQFQAIIDGASGGTMPHQFETALRVCRATDGAVRWLKSTGWKSINGAGRLNRLIVTFQDVTDERNADERIRWAARHDPLTRLPNRAALQEELELAAANRTGIDGKLGLLLFDVDNLKRINDTLGHDAGDALLRAVAIRLVEFAPPGTTVARLGGDEFAMVLPDISDAAALDACALRLLEGLRTPLDYHGRPLDCAASIGAAIFPDHGSDSDELLKSADLALYAAKTGGRGRTMMFQPVMRAGLQRRSSMINMARDAIAAGRIEPFYQPKLELKSGRLVGFEALLRWYDRHGRVHLPETISAAFGDTDLAIAITDRMLEHVTTDLRAWLDAGFDPLSIALNASANDFRYDDFAERVLDRLDKCGLPPASLEIEITETVFLGRGAEYVDRALRAFSAAGIRIALDDFGTGYASLSHLKQYPVDIIKIDRSFVSNLEHSADDAAIVDAIVSLGRNLELTTVAEGIENSAQADHLRSVGCTVGQGFLFGRPQPALEITRIWGKRPRAD